MIAAKGTTNVTVLMKRVEREPRVPDAARAMLRALAVNVSHLDEGIAALDAELRRMAASTPVASRLLQVPGIGPIGAITPSLNVDAGRFVSGRHFAAWVGLTPKERSTGGRQRLGGISGPGNERLRQLLVVGAMAVVRHAKQARQPDRVVLAAEIAGASAAQGRGGGSGQQDGPHREGHDGAWGGVSASADRRVSLARGAAGTERQQKMMIGRTDERTMPGFPAAGHMTASVPHHLP